MKAIIIPELLLDRAFENVIGRVETWKQVCANRPDLLTEHFKLEIRRLQIELKEAK